MSDVFQRTMKIIFSRLTDVELFSDAKLIEIIDSGDKICSPHHGNELVTEIKTRYYKVRLSVNKPTAVVERLVNDIHYS